MFSRMFEKLVSSQVLSSFIRLFASAYSVCFNKIFGMHGCRNVQGRAPVGGVVQVTDLAAAAEKLRREKIMLETQVCGQSNALADLQYMYHQTV